ncbi:MAG: DUF58 domain-containing protein [Dermatophilaceae bacterium]
MTSIRDKLTTRGRAFVAAGLTLMVGGLFLGFIDITRVGVLLATLPLLASLATRRSSDGVVVARLIDPIRLAVDQSANVEVIFENTSRQRTQLQLAEELVGRTLGVGPRFILPPMDPGEVREVSYQIRSEVRGRHRLGPLTLRVRDPFGLATIATSLEGTTDILVLPRTEALGSSRPRANGLGAEGSIPYMVALHGEDDASIRSYRDGDDLRRIHWPTTAHRSELMVRQEDRPARRRAVIVMDSRGGGHRGSGTPGSFEWAVTATASIAAHLFAQGYALNLLTAETTAGGEATQSIEIDSALASLAVTELGTDQELEEVLRCAQALTSVGGLVVAIVTDRDEDVLRRIAALRQPGGAGLLFLLDATSFGRGHAGPPSDQTLGLASLFGAAGWSTSIVGSGVSVADAWETVSAQSALTAGARR